MYKLAFFALYVPNISIKKHLKISSRYDNIV